MAGFSPSDAALEGFRLTRERPGTLLAWSGLYFIGILVIALAMMASLGPDFIEMAQKGDLIADPKAMATVLAESWPAFIVVLLITILLHSVIMGGIYRLILRPSEPGFAHLRLGKDEMRLMGVNLLMVGLGLVFLVVGLMITTAAAQAGMAAGYVAAALMIAVTAWVGVRLSLTTPLTFDQHRIGLRQAWALTKGRFWPLLGMIILAVIFYVMVWLLMSVIVLAIVELSGGEQSIAEIGAISPLAAIAGLVTLVMQLFLQILQVVMIYGPFAVAYQHLSGQAPARP